MCGIAGLLEKDGATPSADVLKVMARRLRHRGPDGDGIHVDGPCGLVHRRLAILDPQRGAQPLSNEDGAIWITYNGEIYNSPELRRRLKQKGHVFRTTTDTEVIVHLYEEDPERFLERLTGIFALALWDSRRRRLVLGRDYIGVKPLYFHEGKDCLVFGSEIKALLADPRVPCAPDERGLMEILAFQNTYFGRTCFEGISLLEPGEMLVAGPGAPASRRKYWAFEPRAEASQSTLAEAAVELGSLLETVVRDQLLSDVPVATYLSGGLDTGALTAIARPLLPALKTFCGGFLLDGVPEYLRGYDEREAAVLMSRAFGTSHHFRQIAPQDMVESFEAIAWHLEEPRGSTCYAPWVMARQAGSHVKVILSGHGGDELFAGYRAKYEAAQNLADDWENGWYAHLNYLVRESSARDWLHPDFLRQDLLAWPRQVFQELVRGSRGLTPMARAQHHDLFVYMQGLLLIEDKLSMAHSLESRVPFLDRRLFDFAWSIPDDWKISQGRGKAILREALRGVLPDAILTRDKMGFGPPDNHYYRTSLRSYLADLLLETGFDRRRIVKPDVVRDLLRRQDCGEDLQQHLWTFVSLEMWHRTFIDRQSQLRARPGCADAGPVEIHLAPAVREAARRGNRGAVSWAAPLAMVARTSRRVAASSWRRLTHAGRGVLARAAGVRNAVAAGLGRRVANLARRSPPPVQDIFSAGWQLFSGAYAVEMRARLEKALPPATQAASSPALRVLHGLYHAPQPVFLNQAFRELGLVSNYETLDRNPAFPMADFHHAMHHPDIYREHAHFQNGTLVQTNPPTTNAANLDQLERFFLERWLKYDVFHFNWFLSFLPDNLDVEFLRLSGRPVYFHFRGCFLLTKLAPQFTEQGGGVEDACRHCRRCGWREPYFGRFHRGVTHASRVFVSTPNLCHCSPDFEYVPNSLEPEMAAIPARGPAQQPRRGPLVVLHAPAHETVRGYKGTAHVIRAVDTLRAEGLDIELRLIQKMSRAEAVQCYGKGDVFIEQLHLGSYGNTAIEAMAHGLPVISSHHPSQSHLSPGCPIVHADPLTLTDRLRQLATDADLRREVGRQCYQWVREFHANDRIAAHLLGLYEEDLGLRAPGPRNVLCSSRPAYDGSSETGTRLPRAA